MPRRLLVLAAIVLTALPLSLTAQDRLKTMPGYEQYQKLNSQIAGSIKSGALIVTWKDGGKAFEYRKDGKLYRYDIAEKKTTEVGTAPAEEPPRPFGRPGGAGAGAGGGRFPQPGGVARGRTAGSVNSPDGKLKAFYRDRNVWLSDDKGSNERQVTTEGNEKARIKFGAAPWIYSEELSQRTAMWWSPDSKKLAFYRFDESKVPDYHLPVAQAATQTKIDVEAYPKPGEPNPVVDLFIHDVETKQTTQVDARDGKPFDNQVVGHYVYNVGWLPDGSGLGFYRTNRRQNILEFAAADPQTGKCRVIIREEWPTGWVNDAQYQRFLKDNRRFIWASERTGWKNFYLYDVDGKLLATLTNHPCEVAAVVRVDEEAGTLFYTARSGDNPMKLQLHRVGLDGKGDKRLTDPAFTHQIELAPDGKHFIDVAQTHNIPPVTRLLDAEGSTVTELAQSDLSKFEKLGLHRLELLKFKAADGETELHGLLHKPSTFDPNKKYPLIVSVYAGPGVGAPARENFTTPSALTEYGFLVASFDSRTAAGRGKKTLDSVYMKLGVAEIDDQAAGVKSLWDRPYVDKQRVGIYGTSYGGTASTLCLLRHPDVFHAACASSAVTDFRLYDTIYTERYMWLPEENKAGYEAGSAMTYVDKLKGRLMIYFGTADNNVHPTNSMQLIRALQRAGKSFEMQVGPDAGHSALLQPRMMEFFIENLVMRPPQETSKVDASTR
jgi:dipeptidyl-peptidase-4